MLVLVASVAVVGSCCVCGSCRELDSGWVFVVAALAIVVMLVLLVGRSVGSVLVESGRRDSQFVFRAAAASDRRRASMQLE